MSNTVTSFIPGIVAGAQPVRKQDNLWLPFPAAPQAMTVYVRFRELGSIKGIVSIQPRLWHIGASNSAAPALRLFYPGSGTGYQLSFTNLTSGVTATAAAAPAIGQLVELRATLTAGGVIQLGQSLNGAAEVLTGTAALTMPQTWSDTKIWVGTIGGTLGAGAIALQNLLAVRGVQSLATMRKYAGVA